MKLARGFSLALTALACASSAQAASQNNPNFMMENRTGFPIWSFYMREHGESGWGDDMLPGDDLFYTGTSRKVTLDSTACHWDIKIEYLSASAWWDNVNLCQWDILTVTWDSATNRYTLHYR